VLPVRRFKFKVNVIGEWDWDQRCIVCLNEVKPDEKVVSCPFCGKTGHKDHFLEWVKVKAICPNCKKNIRESELTNV